MLEMARHDNSKEEIYSAARAAKLDYDAALARFNSATDESMINLAVFDMKAAMKRYCCIVKNADPDRSIDEAKG